MTLIEITIALFIIGLMAAIAVPALFKRPPDRRRLFIADLNTMVQSAVKNAIETNSVHRLLFDFDKQRVSLEKAAKKGLLKDLITVRYEPVVGGVLKTSCAIPGAMVFKSFVIEKNQDELAGGMKTKQVFFVVDNNGYVQDVTIGLGEEDRDDVKILTINPFSKRFEVSDGIKKS